MQRLLVLLSGALLLASAPSAPPSPWASLAGPVFVRVATAALPHPDVRKLAFDSAGFLWVGTPGGLARYDGYGFRSFAPNPSDPKALPDGWIRSLAADPAGGLWIGTESSGLVRFDQQTQTFRTWRAVLEGNRGPRSPAIEALAQAPDGRLWIGGDGGLDHFDPRSQTFEHVQLPGARRTVAVRALTYDREGVLWIASTEGLFYGAGATLHRFARVEGECWDIFEDSAGRLWVTGYNGVFVLDAARHKATRLVYSERDPASIAPEPTTIAEPEPGTIWVGSGTGSISIVDAATLRARQVVPDQDDPGGLTKGPVQKILRDASGLLWIAKGTGGLLFYNPASKGLYQLSVTRPELHLGADGATAVGAIGADRVWAGGLFGVVTRLDAHGSVVASALPHHSSVLAMFAQRDGTVWFGGSRVCTVAAAATVPVCPPGLPTATRMDAMLAERNALWLGTRDGLIEQDRATGKTRIYRGGRGPSALTNRWVTALLRDREGRLWIGTRTGLNRLDADGRIVHFRFDPKRQPSLSPGTVASLLEDRRGRIWAGTIGGQLNVLQTLPDGSVSIRHIGLADGLPHENVDGLAEDARGRIWASTPRGIAMFEPDTFAARAFGPADGVSGGAFHGGSVSQAGDTIFFGGFDGITIVTPGASSAWDYSPPLVVTALSVGRQSASGWGTGSGQRAIDLPPGLHDLTVEFAALDYSDPTALRYQYRLDGFDRDWIATDAAHRVATYTNLPPGTYTLRVRASNRLGAWSTRTLDMRIDAIASWYETWWFRALLVLLFVLAAYGAHRARTAMLHRRQRELEATVEQRTRELSEANANLQQAYQHLEDMSLTDPLTGLRNRRFLAQNIDAEITLALRRYHDWLRDGGAAPVDADVSFFLVDIDHFKAVNDELGHAAGDRVLAQMRGRLEQVFRETDFLVRWGGEEFLVVARRTSRSDAPELAERLRVAVAAKPFEIGEGRTLAKTASIGFAAFPFVQESPDAFGWLHIVELADEALYIAKRNGRNMWCGLVANETTKAMVAESEKIPTSELVNASAVGIVEGQRI